MANASVDQTEHPQGGLTNSSLPALSAPCIVPEMEQGNFTDFSPGSRVSHGQEVNITCIYRYDVIHTATPVSCNNGTWSHVPTCVPARCRQLPEKPKNGLVIAPKTDHGMKALFLCRDGYQLDGPNVTECHYGKWTPALAHLQRDIESANYPVSIESANYPVSIESAKYPVSIESAKYPVSIESANYPTSIESANYPTSIESANYPTSIESYRKLIQQA
ncbi:uncharacterized protein CEXT_123761 [Caerostris extrusa]|uniref:Sushi domain-containing protein n=1 Tax=Caerostris extrusa TaxID=172846 RepID=A0AAV4NJU2_CAEEX|nr:uncharacterized protein CEXT_123761 [Caerostris extrusa]